MKNSLRRLAALCLALSPLAPLHADFNPASVPADAQWVVYLDLNVLRESSIGKELITALEKIQPDPKDTGGLQLDFKKILATIGMATAYGTNFSKEPQTIDGTLILQGTDDLRKIAEGLVAQTTVSSPDMIVELKDLPFEAYSIKGELTVAFPKEPIILVSKSKASLLKAHELFRGKGKSLGNTSSPLTTLIPKTGDLYLLAASVVPSTEGLFPANAPQARILQMANSGSLAISDEDKFTAARLQLGASSDDMADKLLKIVQGATAMLSLTETNDKQLGEFLKSVKTERTGKTITLKLAYPSERLVQMLHSIQADNQRVSRPRNDDAGTASAISGKVIAQWTADQDLGDNSPTAKTMASRTIENIHLKNGTSIILTGRRNAEEYARWDCVEITPAQGGGQPLLFEAENMKLNRYRVEAASVASAGKIINLNSRSGSARFEFPGVEGDYNLKIRYVDENDGQSVFTVSLQDHQPPEAPETPAAPAPPKNRSAE